MYTAALTTTTDEAHHPYGRRDGERVQGDQEAGPFENLLLVTGENPAKAGVDYIERALLLAKPYFANLQIEVMPLKAEEYERLTHAGLNGVICFQETYNKANYNIYHPAA